MHVLLFSVIVLLGVFVAACGVGVADDAVNWGDRRPLTWGLSTLVLTLGLCLLVVGLGGIVLHALHWFERLS